MSAIRWAWRIALILLLGSNVAHGIGVRIDATSGGVLEDAVLFVTDGGGEPRDAVALGDLNLAETDFVIDISVPDFYTSWWLLGHEAGKIVYSSLRDLDGIEFDTLEPYEGWDELDPDIVANLNAFNTGTSVSLDWWVQTIMNHSSHVTADGAQSSLWKFGSPADFYGTVAVNMHNNIVPDGPVNAPDGGPTFALLLAGLAALGWLRRRHPRS